MLPFVENFLDSLSLLGPFWQDLNQKIKIVAEVLPQSAENIQKYSLATIQDLKALKAKSPSCKIRHADITPHIRQNCDATVRVISKATIEELKIHIPQANATRLYLQASLWMDT